ncbi:DUF7342 family protein [Haloarchaeobius sp. DFWS5]|uniref:DUF7342 family protein n=1 Tax=Haloarchaeobius sp. DFWS5 TaxID=3446114 RepID=UPI003EBE468C
MPDSPPDDPGLLDDWDSAAADLTVRDRVYDVAIQCYEPTRVAEVATRADCAKETAREYLRWMTNVGIVVKTGDNPETFERNESYFEWKRVFELQQRPREELVQELNELSEREQAFRARYDVAAPDEVDAVEHADYTDLEAVWDDLDEWRAVRERMELIDRARREQSESGVPA